MTITARPLAVSLVGALSVLGGACSSSTSSTAPPPFTFASQSPTTVAVPAYDPARNARGEVTTRSCAPDPKRGWTLTGEVHNAASAPRQYSIAVDFVTVPGNTVVATEVVVVPTVAAGGTAEWSTPAAASGKPHLTCVVRQALWS